MTKPHIPEDLNPQQHCCANFKSHTLILCALLVTGQDIKTVPSKGRQFYLIDMNKNAEKLVMQPSEMLMYLLTFKIRKIVTEP
jgi:hypothetical protein